MANMEYTIEKETLLTNLKIVEKTTVTRGIQPVLSNILIDAATDNYITFSATDLDINIVSKTIASVKTPGKITLPAKKLSEIVSKLSNKPIVFSLNEETNVVNIICGNSKFELIGISADEFPETIHEEALQSVQPVEIDLNPFIKCIKYTAYSAANYESRNIISGVLCTISKDELEMAATDGNRLTRVREVVKNTSSDAEKPFEMLISSKVLSELSKISLLVEADNIRICKEMKKIVITIDKTKIVTRLMLGQFPKYNQLIPQSFPKEAKVNKNNLISALERVAVMVNEKNSIVKFEFIDNTLKLSGDTPDAGNSQDEIDINYMGEPLAISCNYQFILEFQKKVYSRE